MMSLATFWLSFGLKSSRNQGDAVDQMESPLGCGVTRTTRTTLNAAAPMESPLVVGLLELLVCVFAVSKRWRAPCFVGLLESRRVNHHHGV